MLANRSLVATLAASSALAFISPALAAGDSAPFQAYYSGSLELTAPTTFTLRGAGTATGMGPITSAGRIQMTGVDTSCIGGITNVNTETLTSASGTLSIRSLDVACPIGLVRFAGTGNWRVVGGTGRFAGATGGGLTEGQGYLLASRFVNKLTGAIALAEN
jgi:hypothetical protein